MNVYPPEIPSASLDPSGRYVCPLCDTETTQDASGTWVRCPLVGERYVCLGCCIDHQGAAREENVADGPEGDLFVDLARASGHSLGELVRTCRVHQLSLVDEQLPQLSAGDREVYGDGLLRLRRHVASLLGR